mmetsp:Transcript_39954/g.72886  ORF Transcript_39954/g.72886 Transcript_39954/m.72886 type:complete len:115 (+) Transcript_39954:36-380(+)
MAPQEPQLAIVRTTSGGAPHPGSPTLIALYDVDQSRAPPATGILETMFRCLFFRIWIGSTSFISTLYPPGLKMFATSCGSTTLLGRGIKPPGADLECVSWPDLPSNILCLLATL